MPSDIGWIHSHGASRERGWWSFLILREAPGSPPDGLTFLGSLGSCHIPFLWQPKCQSMGKPKWLEQLVTKDGKWKNDSLRPLFSVCWEHLLSTVGAAGLATACKPRSIGREVQERRVNILSHRLSTHVINRCLPESGFWENRFTSR